MSQESRFHLIRRWKNRSKQVCELNLSRHWTWGGFVLDPNQVTKTHIHTLVDGSCGLARVLSSSSSLSGLDEPLNEDEPDDFPETAEEVVRRLRERLGRQVMRDVTPEGQYKRK